MIRFSDKVMEHFRNPRNFGELENPDGTGTVNNPICGDVTEIYLQLKQGAISDAKFKASGSTVTIASASLFTEKIKGREVSKLLSGHDDEIINRLLSLIENELGELPAHKLHCTPATVQAFLEAVLQYYEKQAETEVTARIKRLPPLLAKFYKRGQQ